ncbi:TIGR04438 family Trp-rich protein [Massilia sp. B-10]|nr:TIGR04438 family Trp-rich protein [Massilia sp. B-10]
MPIILLILALILFKYFEVWKFAEMSWWWVVGLMGVAFIWFEYIEKILGLDKKKHTTRTANGAKPSQTIVRQEAQVKYGSRRRGRVA